MIISSYQQINIFYTTKKYNVNISIVNLFKVKWNKRYTGKELAEASGLSTTTITKLMKGEHVDLKLSTLEKIAKFLKCSVKDILEEVSD